MNYLRLLWRLREQKQNARRTKEQIALLQKQRLDRLLRHAYEHSPYYRRAFEAAGITAANLAETPLERFPTLDKEGLMAHFDELVTDRSLKQEGLLHFGEGSGWEPYRDKYHVVHSSGSTGTPRYFV